MKTTKQIQEKHDEIEKEVSRLRTYLSKAYYLSVEEKREQSKQKEHDLTKQLMTLRWVLNKNAEWDEAGLRDT
jgi:hypothetical protein